MSELGINATACKLADPEPSRVSRLDPLDLFYDRCCVLAERVRTGGLPFIESIDMAYSAALWAGIVDRAGDDVVQAVLARAFMATGGSPK